MDAHSEAVLREYLSPRAEARLASISQTAHTCATTLLGRSVHPKLVQELLGHAAAAMTLDTYSHFLPSTGDQAGGAMGEAFG